MQLLYCEEKKRNAPLNRRAEKFRHAYIVSTFTKIISARSYAKQVLFNLSKSEENPAKTHPSIATP